MFTKKLISIHKRIQTLVTANLVKLVVKRTAEIKESLRVKRLEIVSSHNVERSAVNDIAKRAASETLETREAFQAEREALSNESNDLAAELRNL